MESYFAYLERGDFAISKMHKKAIVIIGLARMGSTTVFNWMTNKSIKGFGKVNSCYVNAHPKNPSISTNYKSETWVPNVKVNFLPGVSLVDMPGF